MTVGSIPPHVLCGICGSRHSTNTSWHGVADVKLDIMTRASGRVGHAHVPQIQALS